MSRTSILTVVAMWVTVLLFFMLAITAKAEVRIAVIDTGLNVAAVNVKVCADSAKSFVSNEGPYSDLHGHGTEVTRIVSESIPKTIPFCIIPIKVGNATGFILPLHIAQGIDYAVEKKADVVNISISGSMYFEVEALAVRRALNKGVILVIAAGNNSKNLNTNCNAFPACYDPRIEVVGYFSPDSNHGKVVDFKASGNAIARGRTENGIFFPEQGSSYAAPRVVAIVVKNLELFKMLLK